MGRGKLALELIPKEKARRITYEKRKKGLMKKAQEFTTLCGVDTCMIIYGLAGSTATTEPEVWPASPEKVKLVIERYRSEGADRRAKRTIGLPEFFANRKRKVDGELTKARLANWEAKYPVSETLIEGFSEEDLRRLLGSLGHKLEVAKARLAVMKEDAMRRSSSHMYDHHIHANDHVYHHHHMQGMFQDHIMPIPMKQPPTDVKPHLDLPYHMQQQQQQQPLFEPDCLNSSIPMPSEWWAQKNQYLNHIPPVPSGCGGTALVNNFHHSVSFPTMQNYQFATLEGMMLSEMSAYGPITGNTSLGGTASSSAACYNNTQLVQQAPPPVPLSVMQGDPIPTQMKQASTQFHEYR